MENYNSTRQIAVTGGAGFLDSHLCRRILDDGHNVICKDNILPLMDNNHFEVLRHDVTFHLYIEVDEIYNLACPASPVHFQHDPVQTTRTSVHGAINMLGLCKRVRAKIFQASTSEVYGDPMVHPQPGITLARERLGWESKIQLEEGLKMTIPYFEQFIQKQL